MQRIKHIDEKLRAWAEWRIGASCGYRSPAFSSDRIRYTDDPVNSFSSFSLEQEALALKMDKAVASLPRDLCKTVVAFYTWEGGIETISSKLGVTRATVHRRLCHSDIRIDDWLITADQQAQEKLHQVRKKNFASYTN